MVESWFEVRLIKDANGIKGTYFLEVKRPDIDGYEDRVIADFFTKEELQKIKRMLP